MYEISTISSCLATGYVFFEIMGALYEKKYTNQTCIYVFAYIGYILMSSTINFIKIPLLNTLFSMIVLCALSYLLYNTGNKNVVINSGIVIIYLAIVDLLVTAVFSTFSLNNIYDALLKPQLYLISGVANALVMICTNNMLIQIILRCQINKTSKVYNIYMIFLLFFEIGVLYYLISVC